MFNYQRLRQRRTDLDLTLEDVGNMVGLSRSAVQKHEKGIIKNIYVSTVEQFAKALRCNPAYLMGWVDDPEIEKGEGEALVLTPPEIDIVTKYRSINEEGQEKVADYVDDLVSSGKYKKAVTSGMGAQKRRDNPPRK